MRLSVLHVYKDYYPPVFGGIEQHLSLLCRTIAPSCDVRVMVSANGGLHTYRDVVEGIEVTRVGEIARIASAPLCLTMPRHLARQPAELYHFHFPNPTGDMSYWLSGVRGRIVVTYHSDIVRQSTLLPLYRPFMRWLLGRADVILATSPQYAASSEDLRPYRGKIQVVPLGIDLRRFATSESTEALARRWREELGGPFALFVGRLRYYKGLDVLLEAATRMTLRVAILGDGPYEQTLREVHARLGLGERVKFLGARPEEDLLALYRAASVAVLPSTVRSEALGLAMIEAMASGTPVVSTEIGTGTSFVNEDGVTGLVVPPNDPGALAAALDAIGLAPERVRTMGEAARRRARTEFSHTVMARRTLEVYSRVTGVPITPLGELAEPEGGAA